MQTSHPSDTATRQKLQVELDIFPPESCACIPEELDHETDDVRRIAVDDRHHADVTVPSSESCCPERQGGCVLHTSADVDDDCPFHAFYAHGWVPHVVRIVDDRIRVQTYLPDREALSGIIETLRRTADDFQVRQLTKIDIDGNGEEQKTATLDLTGLTETKRATAIRAVQMGYYEQPRGASFEEVAREVGISKSALSRRLNAVEASLMKTAFAGLTA